MTALRGFTGSLDMKNLAVKIQKIEIARKC